MSPALRRLTAAIFILGLGTAAWADVPLDRHGLPLWEERVWNDFPVRLDLSDADAVRDLLDRVPLRDFGREALRPVADGIVLELRVTGDEFAALTDAGYAPLRLPDRFREAREATELAWREAADRPSTARDPLDKAPTPPYDRYPTYAEIGTILDDIAAAYPAIARAFTWGTSVEGRELWGLVVSADVNASSAEPEVRLSSTMHGDESIGTIMLLNLAHLLTESYGQPGQAAITELVDGFEIHIMPLHNPDGYVSANRRNANNVDLNRNFPEPAGTYALQEIENQHFMNHARNRHFVVSQNVHTGALVVNYPWDWTYTRAPDDAAMIRLSLDYSTTNLPMYNGGFPQGITNGADWYVATGTLQDWAYEITGCIDVTVELSNTKWPVASTLPGYWDDNRESYLNWIRTARCGINGVVTDAIDGTPLDAVVTVAGNVKPVRTDPEHGDYYKLLDTGTYDLTFTAEGYQARTIEIVNTTWGVPTVLDVALDPAVTEDRLGSCRPNPFNNQIILEYAISDEAQVELAVFDVAGRRICTLVDERRGSGPHQLTWDGRNDDGSLAPAGVYLLRLETPNLSVCRKLAIVR